MTISDDTLKIIESLPGWCTADKARQLSKLVIESQSKLCVELGVFGGRSLIALASGAKTIGGRAIGIDPYTADVLTAPDRAADPHNDPWWKSLDYESILRSAQSGVASAGLSAVAEIRRQTSVRAADDFGDATVDLLHQDSDHSEKWSVAEVEAWVPKLKEKGIWIMNDAGWAQLARAQGILGERGFVVTKHHEAWAAFQRGGMRVLGGPHLGGSHTDNPDFYTWLPDIWERLIADHNIKSVIDVGCGAGFSTKWFRDRVGDAVGVEGDPEALKKAQCTLVQHDYTVSEYDPRKNFDLGWCAEFVEHVEERFIPNWMATLSRCKYVAMTFARPGQGGYHHVNEREEPYWLSVFGQYGFQHVPEVTTWMRATSKGEPWGRPALTFFRNMYRK